MRQSPPPLTRDRVLHFIQRMKSSRVVVVGDIMLDRYLIGDTERLSPEAPVPVVTVRERHAALGGAANVAANVAAMGAKCLLVGAVGDDADGAAIRQELAVARLEDRHVLTIAGRPTTSKTRIIARSQQIVRIDDEVDTLVEGADLARLTAAAREALADADALLLEDYNKGALPPRLIMAVMEVAKRRGSRSSSTPSTGSSSNIPAPRSSSPTAGSWSPHSAPPWTSRTATPSPRSSAGSRWTICW